MKRTSLLGLACTLLLAACQLPFGGVSQPPDVLPGQWGGIVPSPKGPRPLENISLPPLGSWLSTGIAKQGRDLNTGNSVRFGTPETMQPVSAPFPHSGGSSTGAGAPNATGMPQPPQVDQPSADPMAAPADASLPLHAEVPLQGYADLSSSLGPELVAYALDNGYLPTPAWAARPWEFWAAADQAPGSWVQLGDYQLGLGLWTYPDPGAAVQHLELGLQLRAPQLSLAERPALNLTLLVDSSTALKASLPQVTVAPPLTLLAALQTALQSLPSALKPGDQLSVISLDGRVLLDQWQVGADFAALRQLTQNLAQDRVPQLSQSLEQAYQRASTSPDKQGAVILLSSAEAAAQLPGAQAQLLRGRDQGVAFSVIELGSLSTDPQRLAQTAASVGGAYAPVQTLQDARRSLGRDLTALLNLRPAPVQLEVVLPEGLEPLLPNAAATEPSGVSLDSLALNRSLSVLQRYRSQGALPLAASVKVRLHSQDPRTGARHTAEYAQPLGTLLRQAESGQTAASLNLLAGAVSGELPPSWVQAAWRQLPPALTDADRAAQRQLGIWLALNKLLPSAAATAGQSAP